MASRYILQREFSSANPVRWFFGAGTRRVKMSIRSFATVEVQSNLNTSQIKEGKSQGASNSLLKEMRLINARITALGRDTQWALEEIQKDAKGGNLKSGLGMAKDDVCEESDDEVEPWIRYLDKEIAGAEQDDLVSYRLAKIIRESLLSTDGSQIVKAAQQIDSYYRYEYLVSDPFLKFLDGKGTANFLGNLYVLLFDTAIYIPDEDPHQDTLIKLLIELRKLPQAPCKLWNVRCSLPQW